MGLETPKGEKGILKNHVGQLTDLPSQPNRND